ncbi:hypothetical protein GCM10009841_32400 [Microlunatus panaciterrae]|uniref:Uncharacterized protein n=1 Tax=Microlunatus panaciterrae TaxID=400768 RepID=A0ABS2RIV4_9ACTN|nr:hypothetical protein [Microlunatus panaciterrae]MBM7797899.1 hypothetical protein [Microlunatus panaciterrae]
MARKGGSEEGYQGNGTWVHARDARYAARDAITIGCTEVTRDDYTDPSRALEGSYVDSDGKPGVGLVMQFGRAAEAQAYFDLYLKQVRACTRADGPVVATVVPSALGLIDRRTYPGEDEWTEMGRVQGDRLVLVILTDHGHKITKAQAEAVLRQIGGR